MNLFRTLSVIVLFLLTAAGCSCERQAARLQERCPACFATVTVRDTLYRTVTLPGDTVVLALPYGVDVDTVLPNGWNVMLVHDTVDNTEVVCVATPPVTVHDTVPIEVTRPVPVVHQGDPWPLAAAIAALVLSLIILCITIKIKRHV